MTAKCVSVVRGSAAWIFVAGLLCGCWGPASDATAQETHWIWSASADGGDVPSGACHFRKTITLETPVEGVIAIAADDIFELYVNGKLLGKSQARSSRFTEHDISRLLQVGKNVIAVKVTNTEGRTAALAARVAIKEDGQPPRFYSTDASWRTNERPLPFWNMSLYNDGRWGAAHEYGLYGETQPWDAKARVQFAGRRAGVRESEAEEGGASGDESRGERLQIAAGFEFEQLMTGPSLGAPTVMAFNEFGHLIVGRDQGLLLVTLGRDSKSPRPQARVCCDRIRNCGGILPLNGELFVTGEGPDGVGLYSLKDEDQDGTFEAIKAIVRFRGQSGEFGPHGVVLGPDGMIYVALGNGVQLDGAADPGSPYANACGGDLVQPRCEDPRSRDAGKAATGGMVLRTDLEGQTVQVVAGGLNDPRDLAFRRDGALFVHDAEVDSDRGLPWYRPSRLYHVVSGAEFGWRSGWAKMPDYFVDAVPGILDTGASQPTGAVFYDHVYYPAKYQNCLMLADRAQERILAVSLTEKGAGYEAASRVLVEGHPFQPVDLDVGPDGCLYVAVAESSSGGGIYRISCAGKPGPKAAGVGKGVKSALLQPQFHSAWGRQRVAVTMNESGDAWASQLASAASGNGQPVADRVRALEIMQLFGPAPERELLDELVKDSEPAVRAAAADDIAMSGDDDAAQRLELLISDPAPSVRRRACEGLLRLGAKCDVERLKPLLMSGDRCEAWVARRLLERIDPAQWKQQILDSDELRFSIEGSAALLSAHGDRENAQAVLNKLAELMEQTVSDRDFTDMLRLMQLALIKGTMTAGDVPDLVKRLSEEFPSRSDSINRELIRLLAFLQAAEPFPRYREFLKSKASDAEKLHLALHVMLVSSGWLDGQRTEMIGFLEQVRRQKGGNGYSGYIARAVRDFARSLPPVEGGVVLSRGVQWPAAASGVLSNLPDSLADGAVHALCDLDDHLVNSEDEEAQVLRGGIAVALGRSGNELAMIHLRKVWKNEPDQRKSVAVGLAQQPDGENYELLLRSLPMLEGDGVKEVLKRLASVSQTPDDPKVFREVILLGLATGENGGDEAVKLLSHWHPQVAAAQNTSRSESLAAWQKWFAAKYPESPPAELPVSSENSKWNSEKLAELLSVGGGPGGSVEQGRVVFQKSGCVSCHRLGDIGEKLGPDLTGIGQRMSRREILDSILHPSLRIAAKHTPTTLVTSTGRTYSGLAKQDGSGRWTVLQASGTKISLDATLVRDTSPSKKSIMRDGLLEKLSQREVVDLLAALAEPKEGHVAERATPDKHISELIRR
jgi:putative heme-binding domain-containing protein